MKRDEPILLSHNVHKREVCQLTQFVPMIKSYVYASLVPHDVEC